MKIIQRKNLINLYSKIPNNIKVLKILIEFVAKFYIESLVLKKCYINFMIFLSYYMNIIIKKYFLFKAIIIFWSK